MTYTDTLVILGSRAHLCGHGRAPGGPRESAAESASARTAPAVLTAPRAGTDELSGSAMHDHVYGRDLLGCMMHALRREIKAYPLLPRIEGFSNIISSETPVSFRTRPARERRRRVPYSPGNTEVQ